MSCSSSSTNSIKTAATVVVDDETALILSDCEYFRVYSRFQGTEKLVYVGAHREMIFGSYQSSSENQYFIIRVRRAYSDDNKIYTFFADGRVEEKSPPPCRK